MAGETRILVVEDETRIAEVVEQYLERDGRMVLERVGGRLIVDSARRRVTLDGRAVELAESEFRLPRTLARFPDRVYSRYELIDKVQGYDFEGYERTIDAHVKNLRRKLGEDARAPQLVRTVHGRGYAFAEEAR